MTEEGLLIPKEELDRVGEIVITESTGGLTIRPKSMVAATRGMFAGDPDTIDRILERIKLGEMYTHDDTEAV